MGFARHGSKTELMTLVASGFMRLDGHEVGRTRSNVMALGGNYAPSRVGSTCIP